MSGAEHAEHVPQCIVCRERPARNRRADYPTCGSCDSSICRLGQLTDEQSRTVERRAVTRIRRILAARLGMARFVERTQREATETLQRS